MCCFARLRWHSRSLLWYAIALIDVAIGEVGPCNERLPLWVARSTSGLRPCWGCFLAELSTSSLWIVFELTNDARTRKIRAGFDLRHDVRDIYTYIYREKFHSKLVYVGLAQARPNQCAEACAVHPWMDYTYIPAPSLTLSHDYFEPAARCPCRPSPPP